MKVSIFNDFWQEDYTHFERVRSKAKARKFSEKSESFTGREAAKAGYKAERAKKEMAFAMANSHENYAA